MYNKIILQGKMTANYMLVKNTILSDSEATTIAEAEEQLPIWDDDTIALATFQPNTQGNPSLSAASFDIPAEDILGYSISKSKQGTNILETVALVNSNQNKIVDYNIDNRREYIYYIYPIVRKDGVVIKGSPIATPAITTNCENWVVYGIQKSATPNVYTIDEDNIWSFGVNLNSGAQDQEIGVTTYENGSRFNKYSQSDKNFTKSSLTCWLGEIYNNAYVGDTNTMIQKWNDFIADKNTIKILKGRNGITFPIQIISSSAPYHEKLFEEVTVLSFSYEQTGTMEDKQIYKVVTD